MLVWKSNSVDAAQEYEIISSMVPHRESIVVILLSVLCSVLLALIIVFTDGNFFAGGAFLGALAVMIVTLYRLDFGFLMFIGCVLVFDQYEIPGFEPITFKIAYFQNLKEIPYIPSYPAAVVNPLELHLLFLFFVWFFVYSIRKDTYAGSVPMWMTIVLFYVGLIAFFAFGMQRGGKFLVALWEVRALAYLGFMFCFVPQVIQTMPQLRALIWVCIGAIAIKAFQGIARFAVMGFSTRGFPTLTNHEDPLFMLTLVILLFAFVLYNARNAQMWTLFALLVPLLLGFFVAQRRAVYAAILPAFAGLVAMMPFKQRVALFKGVLPVILVLGLYAAVFWNSESRLASPLRLVKTGFSDEREEAGDRYYSNLYREFEKINLAQTVQASPMVGIGFGNKYAMPIPLASIEFPLRDYIPHNQVLWVIVKTGVIGFFLFWMFLDSFAFRAASLSTKLRDPYLKAISAMAVSAVAAQIVVSYFDMQLTYYRNMVYLGTLMGLLSTVEMIHNNSAKEKGEA